MGLLGSPWDAKMSEDERVSFSPSIGHPSFRPSTHHPSLPSICLPFHPSKLPPSLSSFLLTTQLSICLSIHPPSLHPPFLPFIYPSVCPSILPSLLPSFFPSHPPTHPSTSVVHISNSHPSFHHSIHTTYLSFFPNCHLLSAQIPLLPSGHSAVHQLTHPPIKFIYPSNTHPFTNPLVRPVIYLSTYPPAHHHASSPLSAHPQPHINHEATEHKWLVVQIPAIITCAFSVPQGLVGKATLSKREILRDT